MAHFLELLRGAETENNSRLCVGLDPDPAKLPVGFRTSSATDILHFCRFVVDATQDLVCAYKPQIAYFAANRAEAALERLIDYIHQVAPGIPVVLDAKRGDIGATAEQYAREAFGRYQADALTLSPFMGLDSIEPYLKYQDKGLFLLCRTSNLGGNDLQTQRLESGELLYEHIARLVAGPWAYDDRVGLVVGATYPQELARVRELAPKTALLVPGVGAQGASAQDAMAAWSPIGPVLVNASRAVLYATPEEGESWDRAVRRVALATRDELNLYCNA